jgi:glycerol uptake facilitator-like aquaporin
VVAGVVIGVIVITTVIAFALYHIKKLKQLSSGLISDGPVALNMVEGDISGGRMNEEITLGGRLNVEG